ncbi:MAG: HEAT repeat domain-containing protein [Chloroflexota bacterium]|nr:HEAT repeat domain-containing protein [Chloroflexota bacterium]
MSNRVESKLESLIKTLKEGSWEERLAAATTLGNFGESALPLLLVALRDKEAHMRYDITLVLGKMGSIRAVEPLLERLQDEDYSVRQVAAQSLGEIGDRRVVGPLIELLDKEENDYVRQALAASLGKLGDKEALPALVWMQFADQGSAEGTTNKDIANNAIKQIMLWHED